MTVFEMSTHNVIASSIEIEACERERVDVKSF